MKDRLAFSPSEFDAVCRELTHLCPWLSETSGRRSEQRNKAVGGSKASKHLLGMARDFSADTSVGLAQGMAHAVKLGLWATVHDKGSGEHLHIQGLKPGAVPVWWSKKYKKGK